MRLACIRHAASVDPEPGSNSSKNGEALLHRMRVEAVWLTPRRTLHTSVGKVPGDKNTSRRTYSSVLSPYFRVCASLRETLSLPTERTIPGALGFVKRPGQIARCLVRLHITARDGVGDDERKCTTPQDRSQTTVAAAVPGCHELALGLP